MPADAFYEWKVSEGGKQPYAIARQDEPMAFAGLLWEGFRWLEGTVLRTFIIITTDANPMMVEPHHWMPVNLDQRIGQRGWTRLRATPPTLLQPADEDVLKVWPVSKQVNSPQNNCPELLKGGGQLHWRGAITYQSCSSRSVSGRPFTSQASRPPRYQ